MAPADGTECISADAMLGGALPPPTLLGGSGAPTLPGPAAP